MAAKASKTVIGAFVVGAVALAVAGIMLFGSGKFFAKKKKFAVVFDTSVKGLSVGAPLMFKGVKVGEVKDIIVRFDPTDYSIYIPVIVEFSEEAVTKVGDVETKTRDNVPILVEKGMRAQLQMQSFVTGQLMVGIDFFPGSEPHYSGIETEYQELPTIPSTIQQLGEKLKDIDLPGIVEKLDHILAGIDKIVYSPEFTESVASLNQALKDAGKLLRDVDKQVEPLATSVRGTSDAARGAFVQAEKTLAMEEGVPGELITDLRATLTSAQSALGQAEQTLEGVEGSVAEDSRAIYELNNALRELTAAARSIRILTETIEREPEAIIRGKD
jgi:paraquat-inducible protein B